MVFDDASKLCNTMSPVIWISREQDRVISIVDVIVRKVYRPHINSEVTVTMLRQPVDGTTKEGWSEYAALTYPRSCVEYLRCAILCANSCSGASVEILKEVKNQLRQYLMITSELSYDRVSIKTQHYNNCYNFDMSHHINSS